MEGIGRVYGPPIVVASGVYIGLKDWDGVAFICYEDGGATDLTITEATTQAGGSAQNLATVTRYWTSNGVGGAWTTQTQSASQLVEPTDATAQDACIIEVNADELSSGFDFVACTHDNPGIVVALPFDLAVQRKIDNFPATA